MSHQPPQDARLCLPVAAEAMDTKLRIEAFRTAEHGNRTAGELRRVANTRMQQLTSWAEGAGFSRREEQARVGYAPPWSESTEALFGLGVAWVDPRNPNHLHPLPEEHPAIDDYLVRTVRSRRRIPGMAPLPPAALLPYRQLYGQARLTYYAQPEPLKAATVAHGETRTALLHARRRRARETGDPLRLVSFAELLLIEADAAESALSVLIEWLEAHCPAEVWKAVPALHGSPDLPARAFPSPSVGP